MVDIGGRWRNKDAKYNGYVQLGRSVKYINQISTICKHRNYIELKCTIICIAEDCVCYNVNIGHNNEYVTNKTNNIICIGECERNSILLKNCRNIEVFVV